MIFKPNEFNRASDYLKLLLERGKTVKIEHITRSKTLSQNAYCWLCFTFVADETGNSKEDIYRLCLDMFKTHKEVEINGQIHLVPVSLSEMTKEQCSEFIDKFVVYLRSEGFDLPDPEDKKAVDMYNWYKERGLI